MGDSNFFKNPIEPKSGEKVEKLFDHCFEIKKIEEGDRVVVGGNSFFKGKTEIVCDLKNLEDFFKDVHNKAEGANLAKTKERLDLGGIKIDEKLYATLFSFTREYAQKYPTNPQGGNLRNQFYEKEKEGKLSEILKINSAECAEIAILAQFYLQQEGVRSTYFSGEVVWDKNDEEGCFQHTFIIIKNENETYIYDPANPTDGNLPNMCTVDKDFDKEVRLNKKRFVTATNIFNKKEAYYGVGNGSNFDPEWHIAQ